jgi:hypothetical protein
MRDIGQTTHDKGRENQRADFIGHQSLSVCIKGCAKPKADIG